VPKKSTSRLSNTAEYDAFLNSVKLFAIALDSVSAALDRESYWANREKKKRLVRAIDATFVAKDVTSRHFDVVANMQIVISSEGDDKEILRVACQYSTHFHAGKVTQRTAERFAKSEAKIIIWPYFREIVSNLSSRMVIPPITIPLSLET
jgi:preprotein translocase subunit SecB